MIKTSDIITSQHLIISVVGSHAREELADIFLRKQQEIKDSGKSYWLIQSNKAKTQLVQDLCQEALEKNNHIYCLFIEPSQQGGAKPTSHNQAATYVSINNENWENIPDGIRVTGKIGKGSTALVFDKIEILNVYESFDLWEYSEFKTKNPIKMMLGASTVCCERVNSQGMKNHHRKIVGIGRLSQPYGLWLK